MTGTAAIITAVVTFVLTALIGKFLIPFLHKIKFGQPINEIDCLRTIFLHHLESRAFKLSFSLNKITRVSPA